MIKERKSNPNKSYNTDDEVRGRKKPLILINCQYSLLTTVTVTSLELPPFLNLLKEQMWYQPWTTGLKYPEVKGLEVGVEHTPVAW